MFIWYGVGAVAAIVIAWLAALVHASWHAPFGLVPLAVGIALGFVLVKIAATLRVEDSRRKLIVGAILLAVVAVLAEHAWLYLDFRRQWQAARERSPQVAIFRPEFPWSLPEFLENEATPQQVAVWCIDAALIIVSAATTVAVLSRPPASSHQPPTSS